MLKLIASSSQLTPDDYISKSIGVLRYLYYSYVERFHVRPIDILDIVDGVLYAEAVNYSAKIAQQKARK